MKIIAYSNFNDDFISDELVAENVPKQYAQTMADALNKKENEYSTYIYKVVLDDYKLYKFEP